MTTCIPAPTCKAALAQATMKWPGRNHAGDGICPSPQHLAQSPNSDHNGGNAFDLTHDPAHGVDTFALAIDLAKHHDPRVKYIISNHKIWNPSVSDSWRPYTGLDPHTGHMHVSINPSARNDISLWWTPLHPSQQGVPIMFNPPKELSAWCLFHSKKLGKEAWVGVDVHGDIYCAPEEAYEGAPSKADFAGRTAAQIYDNHQGGYKVEATSGELYSFPQGTNPNL